MEDFYQTETSGARGTANARPEEQPQVVVVSSGGGRATVPAWIWFAIIAGGGLAILSAKARALGLTLGQYLQQLFGIDFSDFFSNLFGGGGGGEDIDYDEVIDITQAEVEPVGGGNVVTDGEVGELIGTPGLADLNLAWNYTHNSCLEQAMSITHTVNAGCQVYDPERAYDPRFLFTAYVSQGAMPFQAGMFNFGLLASVCDLTCFASDSSFCPTITDSFGGGLFNIYPGIRSSMNIEQIRTMLLSYFTTEGGVFSAWQTQNPGGRPDSFGTSGGKPAAKYLIAAALRAAAVMPQNRQWTIENWADKFGEQATDDWKGKSWKKALGFGLSGKGYIMGAPACDFLVNRTVAFVNWCVNNFDWVAQAMFYSYADAYAVSLGRYGQLYYDDSTACDQWKSWAYEQCVANIPMDEILALINEYNKQNNIY